MPNKENTEIIELAYSEQVLENKVDEEQKKAVDKFNEEAASSNSGDAFPLDLALETYDPTFPGYTPSTDALDFFNLMRLVQGSDFEFASPLAHYFMADLLLGREMDPQMFPYSKEVCDKITVDQLIISFMESRGMAKSSVVITFFITYCAIKGKLPNGLGDVYFYLILSASTRGGARVNSLAVRSLCEDSVFLQGYFEKMRFTETEIEFTRKGNGAASGRTFVARFQGVGTGIRGQRAQAGSAKTGGATRPNGIIFDDVILNTAAAYSKTIQQNLYDILNSDAENALVGGGKGRILNCFTPFHYSDVNVAPVIAGTTTPVIIPIARMFDLTKTAKVSDITSSWDAMHPPKAIAKQFNNALKKKTVGLFLQERMLQLTSEDSRLIPDSAIQWTDMKLVGKNIEAYTVLITTDYTTTSGENSDFSGVATWAISNNDDWFLLNVTLRKRSIPEQYTATLNEAAMWKRRGKAVEIGVELDGGQGSHVYGLEQMMLKRGDYYSFARDVNDMKNSRKGILSRGSGVKKHERFRMVAPRFLQGKVWFPEHLKEFPDMIEMLQQIKGATHTTFTRSDDGPDLISQVNLIKYIVPTDDGYSVPDEYDDESGIWGGYEQEPEDTGCSIVF